MRLSDTLTYCRPCSDPDSLCDSFVGDVTARLPVECRSGVARRTDTDLVSVDRVLDSSTGLQHRWWLGGRKGIRPVKSEWWGAGVVICLERGADLHMAQRIPLPLTVSCLSKIQISFTFLVPAHPTEGR